jgi:hypothetical protein
LPGSTGGGGKTRRPAWVAPVGPSPKQLPGAGGLLLRFSSYGHRLSVVRFPVGPPKAPASIPTQRGRATWFTAPSASSPAGSRTDLSNCTPLRQGEVGEARDWPRLPESAGAPGIDRRLCPCLHRRPPPSCRSSPSAGVDQAEPDPFPADDTGQYRSRQRLRKCRICFGLRHCDVREMWIPSNHGQRGSHDFPHDVEMWMESRVEPRGLPAPARGARVGRFVPPTPGASP